MFDFILFVDFFDVIDARNGFYFYFEVGIAVGEAFFGLVEEDWGGFEGWDGIRIGYLLMVIRGAGG